MSLGSEKKERMGLEAGGKEGTQSLLNQPKVAGLCPQAVGSRWRVLFEKVARAAV